MEQLHIVTPLLESQTLSRLAGRPVLLKLEALQPVGLYRMGLASVALFP